VIWQRANPAESPGNHLAVQREDFRCYCHAEQLAHDDPKNHAYPLARAAIYRSLAVIQDYANNSVAALAAYKTSASIYSKMLAENPNNPYSQTTLADVQANAALLSVKLGHHAEALQLARASLPVLKQAALQKGRFLVGTEPCSSIPDAERAP
jgi:hypothetical protein